VLTGPAPYAPCTPHPDRLIPHEAATGPSATRDAGLTLAFGASYNTTKLLTVAPSGGGDTVGSKTVAAKP